MCLQRALGPEPLSDVRLKNEIGYIGLLLPLCTQLKSVKTIAYNICAGQLRVGSARRQRVKWPEQGGALESWPFARAGRCEAAWWRAGRAGRVGLPMVPSTAAGAACHRGCGTCCAAWRSCLGKGLLSPWACTRSRRSRPWHRPSAAPRSSSAPACRSGSTPGRCG